MAKHIEDCQTPEELAEAIAYHLKQGGMRRDIYDQTGLLETKYDEFETKRLYGIALNKYNEIQNSFQNLPLAQIDSYDPLSGLAQIQQLCRGNEKSAEVEQKTEVRIKAMRDQVFICYSHKDKRWLEDLQTHLKPYVRNGLITAWSDKQIAPGSKWLEEIEAALASTKVAVLLVTPNFLASDFIHENELVPLLKKAEKGKVTIIWIPIRACSYKESPLKDYQAAVDPEKPLAKMKAERDDAWVRICEEIKKAKEALVGEKPVEIEPKVNVKKIKRKIGIDTFHGETWGGLTNLLRNNAFELVRISSKIGIESLKSVKALIIATKGMNSDKGFGGSEIDAIQQFVNKGGCLLCVDLAWSWVYKKYGNKPLERFPLNVLGKRIGFCIKGKNIKSPAHWSTEIMDGINAIKREKWVPSEIEFYGKDAQEFIMDDKDRIIAGVMPVGEGLVAVVGHRDLLKENPEITLRILAYFARKKKWTTSV